MRVPAQQLIVKPSAENAALGAIKRGTELSIALDLLNQRVETRCVQMRCSIRLRGQRVVEIVCAGNECGPKIGLCLVVLVVLDGPCQIPWLLSKAASGRPTTRRR